MFKPTPVHGEPCSFLGTIWGPPRYDRGSCIYIYMYIAIAGDIGDYVEEYYGFFKGDTRSLDCSSYGYISC